MPDKPRSSEPPKRAAAAVNPEAVPLRISPEALERLRSVSVSAEFLEAARKFIPANLTVPRTRTEVPEEPGWQHAETPIEPQGVETEAEMPLVEVPPEAPPWPQEDIHWREELPPPSVDERIAWPEVPETREKQPAVDAFNFTDLTFDLTAVAHTTPGLLDWEEVPLERIVTDTYPVCFDEEEDGVFEEESGGEGEEIGEEPPCVYCKLILVWGAADRAIAAAREAAARYFDAKAKDEKDKCVVVMKAGTAKKAARYFGKKTKKGEDEWVPESFDLESWLGTDPMDRKIDCFSHVLAIYHGETQQNTINVLNWLARHCQGPIRDLYLWSCWGSEKIDPNDEDVKKALRGVENLTGTRALGEKAEKLEKEIEELEKQSKPNNKKLEETKQELADVEEQLTKLEERLKKCDCELCLYTATPLDKATALARLPGEIDKRRQEFSDAATRAQELRDKNAHPSMQGPADAAEKAASDALKQAIRTRKDLESGEFDQYAMPLGIREPKAGAPLVLLAPETKVRVYCPLNLDDPKFTEPETKRIFDDVPIEPDNDLIVRGLLR